MRKNRTIDRFLAFLLSAALLITYMPSSVYTLADEGTGAAKASVETGDSGSEAQKDAPKKADTAAAPAETVDTTQAATEPEAVETADDQQEGTKETETPETRAGPGVLGVQPNAVTDPEEAGEGETEEEPETFTVEFRSRDGENLLETRTITKGDSIGTLHDISDVYREDYTAEWAIGTFEDDPQGGTWITSASKVITANYKPSADDVDESKGVIGIIPYYTEVERTINFYENEEAANSETAVPLYTKTVKAKTSYCLNDIPTVPAKQGYTGKWVYADGDFTNRVEVTDDVMNVWADYTQTVFTVTFMNGDQVYQTDTYYSGSELELVSGPVVEGRDFDKWVYVDDDTEEREAKNGDEVTSDLTIKAVFKDMYYVNFVTLNDDNTESETLSQYYREDGETIGTMPQDPFISGKVFEKWVKGTKEADGSYTLTDIDINADTVVDESITAVAVFRTVNVYTITAEYYYINKNNEEYVFNTDIFEAEESELPYTITAPSETVTSEDQVTGHPTYYPENPTITIPDEESDIRFDENNNCTVRFKYVPYTAKYDYVYMLLNLDGDPKNYDTDYTEIADSREPDVLGVINSYVTPTVKTFPYANLKLAQGAKIETSGIDGEPKQELYVYYTRKNFQLSYDSTGGSYVGGGTYPYGTTVDLSTTVPTRDGYTFQGWYDDKDDDGNGTGNQVTGSITLDEDTTLYAKWEGKTVNYTIMYMAEQYHADGNTWVYESSRTASGTVGSEVLASSAPNYTSNNFHGYERDTNKDGTEAE